MPNSNILVIEHSTDLADLYRRVLADEAEFAIDAIVDPSDVVEEVRSRRPDLLVLDLLPRGERALEVLDALRTDEVTRAVPILVITTSRELSEAALASYNVRAGLVKPFDLDEFMAEVRRSAGYPTMQARIPDDLEPPNDFMDYVEQVLAWRSRDILFRWVQRLRQESPWQEREDLGLADLIDHAPIVLKAVDVRLHYEDPETFFRLYPDALERAQNHVHLRRQQGIALAAMIREYALLREEIWVMLRAHTPESMDPDEFFQVERAINGTLDAVLTATLSAFQEQRPDILPDRS